MSALALSPLGPHLIECAAMLYLFALLPPSLASGAGPAGMAAMSASCAALCKIAMGLTMGYMLIQML
jgi:hypothetical protein